MKCFDYFLAPESVMTASAHTYHWVKAHTYAGIEASAKHWHWWVAVAIRIEKHPW